MEITQGDAALGRLEDAAFVSAWEDLRSKCAWATTFQSFAFVDCWYRMHDALYEPIILEGRDSDGHLVGLLTLARRRTGRSIVGAGDFHAEYQTWIAEDATDPFVWQSLSLLERSYPRGRVRLNHLPPRTPLAWVEGDAIWPRRIHLRPRTGGLIDLSDPSPIEASLQKGHSRSRLNSLRRYGEVKLESINTVEGLEREMDEIVTLCDLRQGAVNDSLPFRNNPLKRPLHIEMMRRGLLRVTVLRVGAAIASAHLDINNGNDVLLYLVAHAPAFARYSPGSLHIQLLALELAREGVGRYDLSPGGGYKDRFATVSETARVMTVQFGFADRIVSDLSGRSETAATSVLRATGRTPRSALADVRRFRAKVSTPFVRRTSSPRDTDRVVLRLPEGRKGLAKPLDRDHLADLLAYTAGGSDRLPMQEFLRLALHRLEAGHSVLTRMDGPTLIECWWLVSFGQRSQGSTKSVQPGPSAAPRVLIYDPLLPTTQQQTSSAGDIVDRLASTVGEVAPDATAYVALSVGDDMLLNDFIGAGATQIGDDAGLAAPPENIRDVLASGWPMNHTHKAP